MKVLYYIGDSLTLDCQVNQGDLVKNANDIWIYSDSEMINLSDTYNRGIYHLHGLGTVFKANCRLGTIHIMVPRLYIDIGNGFAIINAKKTKGLIKYFN